MTMPEMTWERTMPETEVLERISIDPKICFGKPCIKGHRIWVELILGFLAEGWTIEEVLTEFPQLEEADIRACIAYGALPLKPAIAGSEWRDDGGAMAFERITINPNQMDGLACIRGLRIPVTTVVGQLAAGRTHAEVLADFPDLEEADIYAALEYAAAAVQERELPAAAAQ